MRFEALISGDNVRVGTYFSACCHVVSIFTPEVKYSRQTAVSEKLPHHHGEQCLI